MDVGRGGAGSLFVVYTEDSRRFCFDEGFLGRGWRFSGVFWFRVVNSVGCFGFGDW